MSPAPFLKLLKLFYMILYYARLILANSFTAPLEGHVIPADEPLEITWTASSSAPVQIKLLYGNNKEMTTITASTPNNGSYTWTIPSIPLDPSDYYLAICPAIYDPEVPCKYTLNLRFSIVGGPSSSTPLPPRLPTGLPSQTTTASELSSQGDQTTSQGDVVSTSLTHVCSRCTSMRATCSTVTPTSPSSSQRDASKGLPEESTIAVYIVLVLAVVSIAALWLVVIRRKHKEIEGHGVVQVTPGPASPSKPYMKAELPNDNTRAELGWHDPTDGLYELE